MKVAFYSTMFGMHWGGSEELWSRAAAALLKSGHGVCINYKRRRNLPPQIVHLHAIGAELFFRRGPFFGRKIRRVLAKLGIGTQPFAKWMRYAKPDFVLISVGYHLDDVAVTQTCRALGIPYGLLVQAASPHQWIEKHRFELHRAAYAGAAKCFFVSEQNRDVLESNLALDLSDSLIVDNPFGVSLDAAPAWPETTDRWKLACVARIHFQSKAQDVLLQVLRQPKWRTRPLEVTLFGADGGSQRQLEALIDLYGLHDQVKVGGFVDDIENVWREHHGLVLPSRFEGNALAMIEAMLCGRVPIVTSVGRVRELVDDNECGFVAGASTVELVDEALERAWQRRHEWQGMGAAAARTIRQRHSLQPPEDFANALLALSPARSIRMSRAA